MKEIPQNVSAAVKRLNPHLYNLGAVETGQRQQAPVCPLVNRVQKRQTGKGGVVVIVTLVTYRRRELDDDGNIAALKPIRDAVALSLGLDDADKRIRFEYGQVETRGDEGVMVKITQVGKNFPSKAEQPG